MIVSVTTSQARCSAALSNRDDLGAALAEVCREALDQLSAPVDLAVVFASHHHGPRFGRLAESLCSNLGTETLIGCTGESIIGGDREIEEGPALSLWLANLPGTRVTPLRLKFERTPDGGVFTGLMEAARTAELGAQKEPGSALRAASSALLLLGEPFSFPADALLERLQEDEPGLPVIGGMASGAHEPGANRLMFGPQEFASGAVAVRLDGAALVRSVVSQGCRPVGPPFVVTKAERNLILGLGGKPALEQFRQIYHEMPTSEQALAQRGLHVGLVINEYQEDFSRGDFLVRNVVGADPENGAIGIGDYVRVGQTVRFHLRDARSADEDLRELLAAYLRGTLPPDGTSQPRPQGAAVGALVFTCNGRGTRLFDKPDHDAKCVRELLGEIPTAGFFAQGEIGPIGGRNFVHGFTASVAVFEG